MGEVKPWQIVVIVAAVAAVAVSAYFAFGRGVPVTMANQMTVVDITSGDLYTVELGPKKGMVIPGMNPKTGRATLFPVTKTEAGEWKVSSRDLGALRVAEGEPKALVDAKSGIVKVTSEKPQPLR